MGPASENLHKNRRDVLGIGCLHHPRKQTSPVIVLWIKHIPLAVDYLAVLRDRQVNAGSALSVDGLDGLRHGVGIFAAVLHGFEAQADAV